MWTVFTKLYHKEKMFYVDFLGAQKSNAKTHKYKMLTER